MGNHKETYPLIRHLGLLLFLAGFGLFIGIFFLSDYRLTEEALQEAFSYKEEVAPMAVSQTLPDDTRPATPPPLYWLMVKEAEPMMGETYNWNFSFVDRLNDLFERTNERVLAIYGLSDDEIEKIIEVSRLETNLEYNTTLALAQLEGEGQLLEERQQLLRDYTGWMEGRTYETSEALEQELRSTLEGLEMGITEGEGISSYSAKGYLTSLVKYSTIGWIANYTWLFFWLAFGLSTAGALMYILPGLGTVAGIKHNNIFFSSLKNRGWLGVLLGTFLILFYIILYFYPYYMTNWILLVEPFCYWMTGNPASEFFLYGFLYTLAVLVMGVRMLIKYRHSNYHKIRTASLMFFQLAFAFIIPEILVALNKPYFDFKNIWPLNYDFFFDYRLDEFLANGTLGLFMLGWGIALIIIAVPLFTYLYGKRWYCSWVCGCGALAENLGDPFRQLSNKSVEAWNVERALVHSVLVFAVGMTIAVLYTYFTASSEFLGISTYTLREIYGFAIGAVFAGVVGTGFYPLMGNRVWCRYGCPLAAYIGIIQRFRSRFRITTNGGQCISCGNCSTYCEMGIDVRWYAQRGQNVVRASCVGCGICASVCPRGVLKLENKDPKGRFGNPILIGNEHVSVIE
ncbi:4Fe-4S binding protein [Nafulsella turpanensis]|uniref:4Fe-4S binding protein n=1 Tax=Nafulsella turpanensis TaxID=1265690 RepID=UPI00034B3527|nr:4Fe-4S binding protein [Nafulsella turpanensis]